MPLPKVRCACTPGRCEGRHAVRRRIVSTTRRRDETLNRKTGNAFDVTCVRNRPDSSASPTTCSKPMHDHNLKNHKSVPVTIEVNEPIGGSWRMLNASHTWTKTDAWAAQFQVPRGSRRHHRAEIPCAGNVLGRGCAAQVCCRGEAADGTPECNQIARASRRGGPRA